MTSNEQRDLQTGLQRAIDLYHENRLGEAISILTKLGKKFRASAKLWGYLGFLHREADNPLAAARCFRKTVALSPQSERASLGLFFASWRLKKYDDALKEMGRFALAGKPKEYLALFTRPSTATKTVPSLFEAELQETEAAYVETEAHPHESLIEIHDAKSLRELVNA